jgi:hypothetical protein
VTERDERYTVGNSGLYLDLKYVKANSAQIFYLAPSQQTLVVLHTGLVKFRPFGPGRQNHSLFAWPGEVDLFLPGAFDVVPS